MAIKEIPVVYISLQPLKPQR